MASQGASRAPRSPRQPRPAGAQGDAASHNVRLSKQLSYILRHGANKEKISIRSDGYVKVDDLVGSDGKLDRRAALRRFGTLSPAFS